MKMEKTIKRIKAPLTKEEAVSLRAGDSVLISGTVYTARDAAHKRLCALIAEGKELPFDVRNSVIYFAGPSPAAPGKVIGSAGPTTSYRMDAYSPSLIALGQTGMIGKGRRSEEVVEAMKEIGQTMSYRFKETSEGGLAVSKTGLRIKKELEEKWSKDIF